MTKNDTKYDCIISAGELDKSGLAFLDNNLRVFEVAKHNVSYLEFTKWEMSPEFLKRKQELERIGRDHFGEDYRIKYAVDHFCTLAAKD